MRAGEGTCGAFARSIRAARAEKTIDSGRPTPIHPAARLAPEFCRRTIPKSAHRFSDRPCANGRLRQRPPDEGGGAPKGASIQCPRRTGRRCRLLVLRARSAPSRTSARGPRTHPLSGRARLPALHRGTRQAGRIQRWLSPGPCFPRRRSRALARWRRSRLSALRADRSCCRSNGVQGRPGAGLRLPPAGTALAPSIGTSPVTPSNEQGGVV